MSVTANDIITDALTEIGAIAAGETPSASLAALCLLRFQNQIDSWQSDELTLNLQTLAPFVLTSGTSTFTIGPTGDLVTQRPAWIESMNYVVPGSSPAVEVPMGQMDNDGYASLTIKDLTSSLPQQYYYNATATNGTMFIWPTVTQDVTLNLYLPQGITVPAALVTVMAGPQGYQEAFMYQLALRLCTPLGRPIPEALPKMAGEAYARVKRQNNVPPQMGMDAALYPTNASTFNVLTGTYSGSNSR